MVSQTDLFMDQVERARVILPAARAYKLGLTRPEQSEVHTQPTSHVRLRDCEYVEAHEARILTIMRSTLTSVGYAVTPVNEVDLVVMLKAERSRLWEVPGLEWRTEWLKASLDKLEHLVDERQPKILPVACTACGEIQHRRVYDSLVDCKYCGTQFNLLDGKQAAQKRANSLVAGLALLNRLKRK